MSMKKSKMNVQEPNMAYRYSRAYKQLFDKLSPPHQKRVLQVKENPSIRDIECDRFVREVIALAESDVEL